jgi:DnaJ-class molecular chaperone
MEYRDYYSVLGVKRDASPAEVKRAFRKLAREHHPDRNPGNAAAEQRFKEVNEANEVLSDPEKRKRYDQLGANWDAFSRAGAGGADPFGPGGPYAGAAGGPGGGIRYEFRTSGDAGGFSDFFRTFFSGAAAGTASGAARGRRGSSATTSEGSSFEEILAGLGLGEMPVGGSPGYGSWTADTGGPAATAGRGTGSRNGRGRTGGPPAVEAEVEVSLEEAFHGTSRLVEVGGKRLEVAVPRGVETGSRIRLKGRGGGDPAHPADLFLVTRVRHHPVYSRIGADLSRELPIGLGEALLGAQIPLATLKGRIVLTVPRETQNGRTFRLKGQGMPRLKPKAGEAETGDLLVRVRVVLPTGLSDEATEAARRLVELAHQPDPRESAPTGAPPRP